MPLLWNDGLTHTMQQCHAVSLEAPAATIWAFDDARLIGPCIPPVLQTLPEETQNALFPGYVVRQYAQDQYVEQFARAGDMRYIDTAFSVWNYNCIIYGHFLLEVMPRLLTLRAAQRQDPALSRIPILLPDNAPAFARDWISLLLPEFQIVTKPLYETWTVQRLLIPGWGHRFVYSDLVQNELERLTEPYRQGGMIKRRIFVDRRVESYRVLSNLQELQDVAARYGFESVSPETLSIEQQIALFASAEHVIGEFSSALHNTLFSPAGCNVLAMNYITECQSRIGNFRQQRVGYLLPQGGPIGYDPTITGKRYFSIEPSAFERKLKIMLGAT